MGVRARYKVTGLETSLDGDTLFEFPTSPSRTSSHSNSKVVSALWMEFGWELQLFRAVDPVENLIEGG